MRTAIVQFPGVNRERDMSLALHQASGVAPQLIWHTETSLPGLDLIVLPGGFSYGDYLRCGAMAAHSPVMAAVRDHAARGGYVLGVCNGFQVLTEAGLMPGALLRNASLRFISADHWLRVERDDTDYTRRYHRTQVIRVTMAHNEGNYTADPATLDRLEAENLIAFRYCDAAGALTDEANPNGSAHHIAGVFSPNRRVLGLMPHLENKVEKLTGGTDGRPLFDSLFARAAA